MNRRTGLRFVAALAAASALGGLPVAAAAKVPAPTAATTSKVPAAAAAPVAKVPAATAATATHATARTASPETLAFRLLPAQSGLKPSGLLPFKGEQVTIPRRNVRISVRVALQSVGGRVAAQADVDRLPPQHATLTAKVNGRTFKLQLVHLHVVGHTATLTTTVDAPTAGTVSVTLTHAATASLRPFMLHTSYLALDTTVAPGSTGPFVQLLQQRLAALHIYIPQTGVFDEGTELALDTYHRLLGWGEGNTDVGPATISDLLNGVGSFNVRYPEQGQHVEGDLSDQVLAFIDGSQVQYLFPISSGKPSTPTILGQFQVYYKQPNYTSDGMYYSSFFHGGYAIHGYDPAPDYPASHGCMRLPMVDAIPAYNWIQMGDWVDTYYT